MARREEIEPVRQILDEISDGRTTADVEAHAVSAEVDSGPRALTEAVLRLDAARIEPVDIGIRRATLDDVFLKLTGHPVEEEKETEEAVR